MYIDIYKCQPIRPPCSMCDGEWLQHGSTKSSNHKLGKWCDTMTLIPKSLMLHFYHFIKKRLNFYQKKKKSNAISIII
jgi:hypothetical protein